MQSIREEKYLPSRTVGIDKWLHGLLRSMEKGIVIRNLFFIAVEGGYNDEVQAGSNHASH